MQRHTSPLRINDDGLQLCQELIEEESQSHPEALEKVAKVLNVLCVGAAGFCILGGEGGLNNMTAVWYDTEVRGTAVGMMLGFGRVGGTLGPYVTGLLQQAVPGTPILFVAISVAALLGACLILLVNPQYALRVAERVEAV